MGAAMRALLIAGLLLAGADHFGPHGALAAVLVVTWILTELMTNNAAAALAFPVAVDPRADSILVVARGVEALAGRPTQVGQVVGA